MDGAFWRLAGNPGGSAGVAVGRTPLPSVAMFAPPCLRNWVDSRRDTSEAVGRSGGCLRAAAVPHTSAAGWGG